MTQGWFITYEGGEGAGKTVQTQMMKNYLEGKGFDVVLTREPGGTELAEKIRTVLIGPDVKDMDAITEVFLYAAARREHFKDIIEPALDAGKVVISDRFFDTSIVYQGMVKKGIDWRDILRINRNATKGKVPDLTIYLDIDPQIALERINQNKEREVNRFDKADLPFHYSVRSAYQKLLCEFPNRIKRVNADQTPGPVYMDCLEIVKDELGLNKKEPKWTNCELTNGWVHSNIGKLSVGKNLFDYSSLVINPGGTEEPLLYLGRDGVIKWNGRVVTKDEELVAALRDLLTHT